jgi:hypothetical protein
MRKRIGLSLLVVIAGSLAGGCTTPPIDWGSTPVYSSAERGRMTWRNWNFEGAQAMDDIDHALLLRPSSRLTEWHVR